MDENELKVISEIQKNSKASQRELSKILNLSLGMTNIVLHRLIEKGYMKIKQLDGRRVNYILTPKGFSEKLKRSSEYIFSTIDAFLLIKSKIKKVITGFYDKGNRNFIIFGGGELINLTELSFKELDLKGADYLLAGDLSQVTGKDSVLLYAGSEKSRELEKYSNAVNLSNEIAKVI
ncbi:MAG: winged helix-turn-helix transcriptional regulator, partial [Candidatus Margulisiibacteriota bacterium]